MPNHRCDEETATHESKASQAYFINFRESALVQTVGSLNFHELLDLPAMLYRYVTDARSSTGCEENTKADLENDDN